MPTPSRTVPSGPGPAFQVKHEGYRCIARRDGDREQGNCRGPGPVTWLEPRPPSASLREPREYMRDWVMAGLDAVVTNCERPPFPGIHRIQGDPASCERALATWGL